jgi:hypothetical protein
MSSPPHSLPQSELPHGFWCSLDSAVRGVTKSLFLKDAGKIYTRFTEYAELEMLGPVPFSNPTADSWKSAFAEEKLAGETALSTRISCEAEKCPVSVASNEG